MRTINFYMVDAFSDRTFGGNAAAVCPLSEWLSDDVMLRMAQQHNQSETAFFVPKKDGFALRWFTTLGEIDLCGHATLAAAHVIFNHLEYTLPVIVFDTASGRLTVSRDGDWLTLDFPVDRPRPQTPPASLMRALGIARCQSAHKGRTWLIELASREQVEAISPDITAMIPGDDDVTVTAPGGENYDFVSRFFSPGEAVWEDPVTGSAHTMLIPYWAEKLAKNQMLARQVSARGGDIRCELKGSRVLMSGQAKTYIVGKLMLD